MTEQEIKNRIIQVVKTEVNLDLGVLDPAKDVRLQVELDSMQMVEIYAAIVEYFGIEVPVSIVSALTFNQIASALKNELDKQVNLVENQ